MANQSIQTSSTNSPPKGLTRDDLPDLCEILNPVAPKCFELGLQLGVKKANIDIIMKNNKDDCQAQLREIISERLKQDSPLTWPDIVTALKFLSVNHPDLARQIESQYISLNYQQHSYSDPQQESAGSSHMTSVHHSLQAPTQYPTSQTHTALTPPLSASSVCQPLPSLFPKQCPSQPPLMFTPSPAHPSFQSYQHPSQIQPHIPTQYPSLYHPSLYPFLQWQHFFPPQLLQMPPPSILQSVSSSDQSSSIPSSVVVARQSNLQCTQPDSIHVSSSILPHICQLLLLDLCRKGW